MVTLKRIRLVVSGRVQGVGFRYFTRSQGERYGLVGWVRNVPDGTVEAEAEGSEDELAAFVAAVQNGPSASQVTDVLVQEMPATQTDVAFDIRLF